MKRLYVEPEFELYSFNLAAPILAGDENFYSNYASPSAETPLPGYDEDVEIEDF